MLNLDFYVEEQSAETALRTIVPEILRPYLHLFEFNIYHFSGKPDLLRKLPGRLRAYRHRVDDWRVIVLIDRDDQDCVLLKQQLEAISTNAGFVTRSGGALRFKVINRIACEELEAWFFGDVDALVAAYPRLDPNLGSQAPYRDPDAIRGGTWEALEHVLEYYHHGGLEKIRASREISQYMDPDRNRSKSFQVFRDALRDLFA